MVKRTSHKRSRCPVARPLDAIGDWWSLLIVRDAFGGTRRFGEFQKSLGAAKNILSSRLRNLVDHGILRVVPAGEGSGFQEYVLTEKGRGLFPLLVALRQWGEEFFFDKGEDHVRLVDLKRGLPVRKLELRAQDGRILTPEDTIVVTPALPGTAAAKQAPKIRRGRNAGCSASGNEGQARRRILRPDGNGRAR
jgi:DNA-binding HxlR family transcriptional regulator